MSPGQDETMIVRMKLAPHSPRQLGEKGLIVFWRDGLRSGEREGLACLLSACPHHECECQDVCLDGFLIEQQATAVRWERSGLFLESPAGSDPAGAKLEDAIFARVDPLTGETAFQPDLPAPKDPALLDWLESEMNGELLDLLYRFWTKAKGFKPERAKEEIDRDALEGHHLTFFDELIQGARSDEYLLAGRRYWAGFLLCPHKDCRCGQARIVFFDEEGEGGDSVGSPDPPSRKEGSPVVYEGTGV